MWIGILSFLVKMASEDLSLEIEEQCLYCTFLISRRIIENQHMEECRRDKSLQEREIKRKMKIHGYRGNPVLFRSTLHPCNNEFHTLLAIKILV